MKKFREILSSGDKGFTLIELLVVIAVLGILAGIAIPRLGGVTNKAELAVAKSFGGNLRSAMALYDAENGNYPDFNSADPSTALEDVITLDKPDGVSITGYTSVSGYTITIEYNDGDTLTVTQGGISE